MITDSYETGIYYARENAQTLKIKYGKVTDYRQTLF